MIGGFSDFLALALFTFLILLALSGNVLVCVAIFVDRKLRRQPENLFLVSLAVSDLFVSVLVMIFAAANDLFGYWPFGEVYCQFWICLDITCSTASILNLCAIAFDRYLHISKPMKYSRYSNKSTISVVIILIWLLSAFIGSAQLIFGAASSTVPEEVESTTNAVTSSLITSFDHNHYRTSGYSSSVITDDKSSLMLELDAISRPTCYLKLRPLYAIVSSILSFFLPATIMVLLYTKLYLYARMHVRSIRSQLRQATSLLIMQLASSSCERIRQVVVRPCYLASHTALHYGTGTTSVSAIANEEQKPLTTSLTYENNNTSNNNNNNKNTAGNNLNNSDNNNYHNNNNNNNNNISNNSFVTVTATAGNDAAASLIPANTAMIAATVRAPDNNANLRYTNTASFPEAKANKTLTDQKARLTLGVIMGTFLICWLPFFVVNVLRSLFPQFFSQRVFQIVTWLGYANSTANPVIYGIFNRDFRRAFTRIVLKIFYCFNDSFDNNYKQQRSPFFNHHSKL